MIPIYSTVSFLSYLYYKHSIYYEVLRDCYEAFAIASFFTLLCNYIAPNLHEQKDYFRQVKPINWFWGVFGLQKCTGGKEKGILRIPRSGLTWFNVRPYTLCDTCDIYHWSDADYDCRSFGCPSSNMRSFVCYSL
jgi:hypothetical protein